MGFRHLFLLVCGLLWGTLAFAQTSNSTNPGPVPAPVPATAASPITANSDWYLNKPIQEIRFEGLQIVQKSELEGVTRPYIGKKFTDELFLELQGALYNLDYFEGLFDTVPIKADVAGSQVILLFKVKEKPAVVNIIFVGNQKVIEGDLSSAVLTKKGEIVNQARVTSDETAIKNLYLDKGFLDISVTSSIEKTDDHKAKVYFTIKEGIQTSVKSIQFQGNTFYSEGDLKGMMDTKEQFLFISGFFKDASFAKDQKTIENNYWNNGFEDAKIIDVQKNPTYDKETGRNVLNLRISINEGVRYTYGGISFSGNKIFTNDEIKSKLRFHVGDVFNKDKVEADFRRIQDMYYENGYIFNDISRKEIREDKSIRYEVTIIERPRAHIESIIIKGNTKTKEKVILRELPFDTGDVFSKARIMEGLQNLQNLQYFSSVTPETPQGTADGLMDLVVNVEEGKTADVSFGLAFSGEDNDFPVSATMKWSDKNFMGNGQTVTVDSSLSPYNQGLTLGYSENWFMDQRLNFGGTIGFTHAINTSVPNDVISPLSSGLNTSIPDPYDPEEYVFSESTTYNGVKYNAGEAFPIRNPSSSDIEKYDLVTKYEYDLDNGTAKYNTMRYESYKFSLGLNTGYSWYTPLGRFSASTGFSNAYQFVTYDNTIYRPANESLRTNYKEWKMTNQWWNRGAWDTRDILINPTSGFLLSQTFTFSGGFIGGNTDFTRSDSKGEAYVKLLDIPIVDFYDFQTIFKLRSSISFLMDSLGGNWDIYCQPTDELSVDGMLAGRGWGYKDEARATWTSSAELRFPIVPQYVWLDCFVDHSTIQYMDSSYQNITKIPFSSYMFSWGIGPRVVTPQFPIALYFVKPFKIVNGDIVWETGDGIFGKADMKMVFAFGFSQ